MKNLPSILPRWFPAVVVMSIIFLFSSQPAANLPDFQTWDYVIKKSSHVIGYGLLASSFLYLVTDRPYSYHLSWLLTILYAATDEFHQTFVSGRSASVMDVLIFDNLGAVITMWIFSVVDSRKTKPAG